MVTDYRKKQLNNFAQFVSDGFSSNNITLLDEIVISEELSVYHDHYEDSFDGMLVYDEKDFHIHVNVDKGNLEKSKRGRFTFAHELGHYFIDEHRIGLMRGILQPHASQHELNRRDLIEEEADYFAGSLLMPENRFRIQSSRKMFSLDTITELSDSFQASILATVLRFTEIGTHEMMAVVSENNRVKWYSRHKDFPQWAFKFKVGQAIPPTTVAGEFFTKKDSRYTGIEDVSPDDWFYPKDARGRRTMHEQCYYCDSYGYVISLLWFD